jgi:hypothetical protein
MAIILLQSTERCHHDTVRRHQVLRWDRVRRSHSAKLHQHHIHIPQLQRMLVARACRAYVVLSPHLVRWDRRLGQAWVIKPIVCPKDMLLLTDL